MRIIPNKKEGKTTSVRSKLYPKEIIHAVSVVPMLAPMMMEIACANVSKPALTKDTVMTVVAEDDCTVHVTNIPVSIPVHLLVVMLAKM